MCYDRVYFDSSFEVVWTWEEILQFLAWFGSFRSNLFQHFTGRRKLKILKGYLLLIIYESSNAIFKCESWGNLRSPFW